MGKQRGLELCVKGMHFWLMAGEQSLQILALFSFVYHFLEDLVEREFVSRCKTVSSTWMFANHIDNLLGNHSM